MHVRAVGSSHSGPGVHLRRGHIRRLKTKNVWVNACVVGNKLRVLFKKTIWLKPASE